MYILHMSSSSSPFLRDLSSVRSLTSSSSSQITFPTSSLSFPRTSTVIRMGGGPRTFPGGVSKWQWKRMQAKKAKQLLKARLSRERQIYEMRKRAELRAAVTELERPWEVVERAPTLFSVSADEQLKTLADRFQKPGGYDLWSERDGPQLFHTPHGLPSARFFPKGVVHSVKPYGKILDDDDNHFTLPPPEEEEHQGQATPGSIVKARKGSRRLRTNSLSSSRSTRDRGGAELDNQGDSLDPPSTSMKNLRISSSGRQERQTDMVPSNDIAHRRQMSGSTYGGRNGNGKASSRGSSRNRGNGGRYVGMGGSQGLESALPKFDTKERGAEIPLVRRGRGFNSGRHRSRPKVPHKKQVYDMSLKHDGSYEFQANQQKHLLSGGSEGSLELDSY